jgi:chorismate mutase/prephenate dehydratase
MSVDELRERINALDDDLLELLEQRAKLATEIAEAKKNESVPLHDPEREQHIFERLERSVESKSDAAFPKQSIRPVFREIISACLSIQAPLKVVYFGPPGTFTHMAAQSAFGLGAEYLDAGPNIAAVFDAVARGSAAYGVAPIENSTEGGVSLTLDCLLDKPEVKIRNELVLDINQCLVSRNTELSQIQRVYSHTQPLAQCRVWLSRNVPHAQLVVSPSTSVAAREAAADEKAAAVASRLAANLYGLSVIRENIQDRPENATRFVILALSDAPPTGRDKTTMVFSTPHERGALRRVLEIFDEEGINLTRIESRPRGERLWEYDFFTDLEGHRLDLPVARAIERLEQKCAMVRVLGSYPRA